MEFNRLTATVLLPRRAFQTFWKALLVEKTASIIGSSTYIHIQYSGGHHPGPDCRRSCGELARRQPHCRKGRTVPKPSTFMRIPQRLASASNRSTDSLLGSDTLIKGRGNLASWVE